MTIHREADYRGRTVRNAQGVISQNLDTVESGVDIAIETAKEAVHELRERQSMNCVGKHRMSLGETVRSVQRSWDKKRPRIKRYMESHPWIVFGALLLLAYLFSSERKDESLKFQS